MSVYVDTPFRVYPEQFPNAPRVFRNALSAHLMADTDDELMEYAKKIGLNLKWVQDFGSIRCHFDVTGKFLERVQRDETVLKLTPREMAFRYMAKRTNVADQSSQATA